MKDEHIRRFVLSENTVVYGWIHKDNLLLWKRCLSAEVGQIDRKALIVNDIWDVMGVESVVVHLMSGLGDNYSQSGLDSSQLKFFFVYKHSENKNWVLLGREIRIPVSTKDKRQVVVGWVRKPRLTFWNSRVAVEPNWEPAAAAERKNGFGQNCLSTKDTLATMAVAKIPEITRFCGKTIF